MDDYKEPGDFIDLESFLELIETMDEGAEKERIKNIYEEMKHERCKS